jgi:hypothetical protein
VRRFLVLAGALSLSYPASSAESYLVIIAGLGGEESYRERFHDWSMKMREAATKKSGLPEDHVFYLGESPELAPEAVHAKSTKENVASVFQKLRARVRPGDQLYVLLLGHGSYDADEARFNLPGRDLTASDFDALLDPFGEQQIVFVNTASASGAFLPVLAAKNRIVVTSTKSGFERNESQFGKYFVEAYAGSGEADTDKNDRVSVLEAFEYARLKVDGFYKEENLLKTEHAQLDDDGDGEGVGEPSEREGDVASAAYLTAATAAAGDAIPADALQADPELARLAEKKRELEGRVAALRLQKDTMPEELYLGELEKLLLELAELSASIDARARR